MSGSKNTEENYVLKTESSQDTSDVSPVSHELSPSSTHRNEGEQITESRDQSPAFNSASETRDKIEQKEDSYVLYPVTLGLNAQQPLEFPSYKEPYLTNDNNGSESPDNWVDSSSREINLIRKNFPIEESHQKTTVIYLRSDNAREVQPVPTQYISIDALNWKNDGNFNLSSTNVQENQLSTVMKSSFASTGEQTGNLQDKLTSQNNEPEKVTSRTERIPRPPNAFMIFGREHRKMLAMQHKDETNKTISVRLGNMWRNLPKDIKDSYYMKAKLTEFEHQRKYPDYEYNPIEARKRKNDIRLARIGNKKSNAADGNKGSCSTGNKSEVTGSRKGEHATPGKETEPSTSKQQFFTRIQRPTPRRPFVRYAVPTSGSMPTRMAPPTLRFHSPYSPFNAVPYRFCHPGAQLRVDDSAIPKIKSEVNDNETYLENSPSEQLQEAHNETDSITNPTQSHSEEWKSSQYTPISMSLVNQCPCHSSGRSSFSQDHPLYYISSRDHPRPLVVQNSEGLICPQPQFIDTSVRCIQATGGSLGQKQVINPMKIEKSEMKFSSKGGRFQASSNVQKMELSVVREHLDSNTPFTHFSAYPTTGGNVQPQLRHESQLFPAAGDPCGPLPPIYRPRAYYYHYGNSASVDTRDHFVTGWDRSGSYWMDNCLHNQPLTTSNSSRPEIVNALSDALDTLNYETSHL